MAGLGFIITLLDLIMRTSRLQDLVVPGLHVPAIVMVFGAGALLLSGRLFQPMFSKMGRLILFFTFLMFLSVGVSVWPGGAYQYVFDNWIPLLPMFFLLCGFVRTFRQLKTSMVVAACGYAAISYLGMFMSSDAGVGRIGIGAFTFGNSNDLAMVQLFGLPLSVWAVLDKRGNSLVRLFLAGSFVCAIPVFFRTGSRAGLLALAGLSVYVLFRQRLETRIRVAVVAVLVVPIGLAVTPARVMDRYSTLVTGFFAPPDPIADPATAEGAEVDEAAVGSAVASASGRLELLKRSIVVSLQNPLLGVGPGMFVVAENELAVSEGRKRGYWKASHNMYTQISSELGLPAAILYVYLMVLVWKMMSRAEKADPRLISFAPELRKMAFPLKATTLVFALFGVTLSIGYAPFLPMLCGWCIAIERFLVAGALQARANAEQQAEEKEADGKTVQPEPEPVFARAALRPRGNFSQA